VSEKNGNGEFEVSLENISILSVCFDAGTLTKEI
jgi:hypothetical protein